MQYTDKDQLLNLEAGTTVFTVNPYDNGFIDEVRVYDFTVDSVENGVIITTTGENKYPSDLLSMRKGAFSSQREAFKYLDSLVGEAREAGLKNIPEVVEHHNWCKTFLPPLNPDCGYWD